MKKKSKLIMYLLIFMLAAGAFAPMTMADSIMDRVESARGSDSISQLEERANEAGDSFIKFLRNTAIIVAVIMFVIVAYALLFSPNVKTISDCKGRVGALVLALAIAIMAEEIVGTLMNWFGG